MQSWRDSLTLVWFYKNKSLKCSSVELDGTLSHILAIKTMHPKSQVHHVITGNQQVIF